MGKPLKNPPVYFTLAQVRFNAILKLADFMPSIQEAFRKFDFPDFTTHKAVVLQMVAQEGQFVPAPAVQERFVIGNARKTHSFILVSDSLTLQSTDYRQFEVFSNLFDSGLSILHSIVGLNFTERVGLRYLDRVIPRPDERLERYLQSDVLALTKRLKGEPQHSYSETLMQIDEIKLRSRVIVQNSALAFPPDITPGEMVVDGRLAAYEGLHAILDNDGFVEGREDYSARAVNAHLFRIHDAISNAFLATVSDTAIETWNE